MIKIFNNKIVYDNGTKKKVYKTTDLPFFLGDTVELDSVLTFGELFKIFHLNRKFINVAFAQTLGFYNFDDFYTEIKKPISKKEAKDFKNEYLEVYHVPDLWKYEIDVPFDYNPYFDLHLIKKKDDDGKDNVTYSISLTKLNTLKNHRIVINKEIKFHLNDASKPMTESSLKEEFTATYDNMRLFDLINAILYEISFHGSPANRNKFSKELEDTLSEFKESKK